MVFDEKTLAEYKEAFGVIDKDGDGTIDHKELKACFEELGKSEKDAVLKAMVAEVKGPLNLNAFLKMFEDKLNGTDEENILLEAFKLFDEKGVGALPKDLLKDMLVNNGRPSERLTEEEFKICFEGVPEQNGAVNYSQMTQIVKRGKIE